VSVRTYEITFQNGHSSGSDSAKAKLRFLRFQLRFLVLVPIPHRQKVTVPTVPVLVPQHFCLSTYLFLDIDAGYRNQKFTYYGP
jgi:hypothetical protein